MAGMQGNPGMGWGRGSLLLFDELEVAAGRDGRPVGLNAVGWIGGAYNRLWARSEGEYATSRGDGEGDVEVFYGHLVHPYWDALIGARVDARWGNGTHRSRQLLAVGLQGLAPLRFEFEPTVYLSTKGDVSARLETSYQFLFTQRVVAEPELKLNVAGQSVPEFNIGSGLTDIELGTRIRYEIRREVAPYIGLSWSRAAGSTAGLIRRAGGSPNGGLAAVVGARLWK